MACKLAVVLLTAIVCFGLKDTAVLAQSECSLVERTTDSAAVPTLSKSWSKRCLKVWKRELNFQAGKEKSDGYVDHQKNELHGTVQPISFESPTRATEQFDGAFATAPTLQDRNGGYDAQFQKPLISVQNLMALTQVLVSLS